jgi:hypothetical protein
VAGSAIGSTELEAAKEILHRLSRKQRRRRRRRRRGRDI